MHVIWYVKRLWTCSNTCPKILSNLPTTNFNYNLQLLSLLNRVHRVQKVVKVLEHTQYVYSCNSTLWHPSLCVMDHSRRHSIPSVVNYVWLIMNEGINILQRLHMFTQNNENIHEKKPVLEFCCVVFWAFAYTDYK